jgi:hypothetical protein
MIILLLNILIIIIIIYIIKNKYKNNNIDVNNQTYKNIAAILKINSKLINQNNFLFKYNKNLKKNKRNKSCFF